MTLTRVRTLIEGLGDLLLGVKCLGCGVGGHGWCRRCVVACWDPQRWQRGGVSAVSSGQYDQALRHALVAHKDHGQLALARPLGDLLAAAIKVAQPQGPWWITPCPSAAAASRKRGQQHMQRVAVAASRRLRCSGGEAAVLPVLHVVGKVSDQVGLTAVERRENLTGAFVADPARPPRRELIIVDDIATTGATLDEASRALVAAGWWVTGAAVVARTGPRSGVAAGAGLG